MVTSLFFTLHDLTKSQSIRLKKKPIVWVLTVIPSYIITFMSVSLIYTRDETLGTHPVNLGDLRNKRVTFFIFKLFTPNFPQPFFRSLIDVKI